METHITEAPGTPAMWMREMLERWLQAPDRVAVRGWLHECGLPPMGHRDEPYLRILSGLPQGAARADAETILAHSVREELNDQQATYTDTAIWNLLLLAAGLAVPDVLAAPLHRWFERRHLSGRSAHGVPLTEALRSALIENQADTRYRDIWLALLRGDSHPYLGAGVTAGFDGILWMRSDSTRPADVDAIGEALLLIAKFLDSVAALQPRRRPEFRGYIKRVMNAYPDVNWPTEFIRVADRSGWDQWAVETLPTLLFPLALDKKQSQVVVWTPLLKLVPNPKIVQQLCAGHVSVLQMPSSQVGEVQNGVRHYEHLRRLHDLPTSTGMLNTVACAVASVEDLTLTSRKRYEDAHFAFLTEMNVRGPQRQKRRKSALQGAYS